MKLLLSTDGGARGNPGPAGIGVVIQEESGTENSIIHEISEYIGETTNNQAEYEALIQGLTWVRDNANRVTEIECLLDSELIVRQLNGIYKVKEAGMQEKFRLIQDILHNIDTKVVFKHIPREQNKRADLLVNKAIDRQLLEG